MGVSPPKNGSRDVVLPVLEGPYTSLRPWIRRAAFLTAFHRPAPGCLRRV